MVGSGRFVGGVVVLAPESFNAAYVANKAFVLALTQGARGRARRQVECRPYWLATSDAVVAGEWL